MTEQRVRAIGDFATVAFRQAEAEGPDSDLLKESLSCLDSVGKYFQTRGNHLLVVQTAVNMLKIRGWLATVDRDAASLRQIATEYGIVMQCFGGPLGIFRQPEGFGIKVDWAVGLCRVDRAWVNLIGWNPEVSIILNAQEGLLETALTNAPNLSVLRLERAALHRCRTQHGLENAEAAAEGMAKCMEEALDILRSIAADYTDPQVRAGWVGSASKYLQELAETVEFALTAVKPARLDIAARMVSLAQFLRARARQDLVRNLRSLMQMQAETDEVEDLIVRIRSLNRWLDQLDARGRHHPDSPSRGLGTVPTEPETRRTVSLEEVTAEIFRSYPEYEHLETRGQIKNELEYRKELLSRRATQSAFLRTQAAQLESESPFDFAMFQTNLAEGEVVLDYYIGPSSLHVGVISRSVLDVLSLPIADPRRLTSLTRKISYLANEILRSGRKNLENDSLAAAIQQCSAWLIPENLVKLLDKLEMRRLYIVANGPLWRVPFAWLEVDGKLALERWEICVVPSARLAGQDEIKQIHKQAIIVGHPGNPYLESVSGEVQSVSSLLRCRSLFETEAKPQRVLREMLPEAGIIHFACHGFCDPVFPLTSSLSLEPDDQHPDGQLMFYEILSVPLHAQVVSLGACHTAESEGPISFPESLGHAFLGAGARFVIASLWAAVDEEARSFAHGFYGALNQSKEPPVAFRQAQLQQVARLRSTLGRSDYASFVDEDFAWLANFVLLGARRKQ
jgi:CHAT domain-containing protein